MKEDGKERMREKLIEATVKREIRESISEI